MLGYISTYIFGDDQNACQSTTSVVPHCKQVEDDWCYVDDNGRFQPFIVDELEIRDIDELSLCSMKQATTVSSAVIEQRKRAEELRQAKKKTAERMELERALFEEDLTTSITEPSNGRNPETWQKLKAKMAHDKSKTKRSKKASGKSASGRSNDRKCNNIE